MLFADISRDFKGPRNYTEPAYDYLNRSARPSMTRIRELLDCWFSAYPPEDREELSARFHSHDENQHNSAFFELYLHALLTRMGYWVQVHPEIPNCGNKPDFLVLRDKNPIFYLEATLATGPNEETAAEKRKNVVYETIDGMNSQNFWIGVEVKSSTENSPPGRKWRKRLEIWLGGLDPDAIGKQLNADGLKDMPRISLGDAGWNVEFQAIPKSPAACGEQGVRPIGLHIYPMHLCNEDEWIKNAIKDKATKYGDLNLPYFIAINVLSIYSNDELMIMYALFGKKGFRFYQHEDGRTDERLVRAPNGAFRGPNGPQNTRVSGVLICNYLTTGSIAKETPILWHNPWASNPIDISSWPLPQRVVSNDKTMIERKSGCDIREIFSLPRKWPMKDNERDIE